MHTHVRVDDDAGTGDLSRRATGGDTPADTCSDTARISSTPWKFHESFARECRFETGQSDAYKAFTMIK